MGGRVNPLRLASLAPPLVPLREGEEECFASQKGEGWDHSPSFSSEHNTGDSSLRSE